MMPFVAAIRLSDLKDLPLTATVEGWPVLIARVEGKLHAVINRCPHANAAFLPEGRLRRSLILCPKHGARFNIEDGSCVGGAYRPLRTFPCQEVGEWIEIEIPDQPYQDGVLGSLPA